MHRSTAVPQAGLARHTRTCRLMSPSVPCSRVDASCWCLSRFSSAPRDPQEKKTPPCSMADRRASGTGVRWAAVRSDIAPWVPRRYATPAGRQASACCVSPMYIPTVCSPGVRWPAELKGCSVHRYSTIDSGCPGSAWCCFAAFSVACFASQPPAICIVSGLREADTD